jgi:hypothetical protein
MKPIIPLVLASMLVAACIPIPVKHSEQITPAVVGTLSFDDGRPARQYFIAATDEDEDRACSRPGGRGVTNDIGHFQLPQASEEKKILWLTLMENLGMRGYWLCARPAALGAPGGARVEPLSRTYVFGHFRGDTLDCLQWSWRDTTRLSCNANPNTRQILRGGSWTQAETTGSYRLLFVQVGRWLSAARVVVQWVSADPGMPNAVRAQMDLPTRDSVEIWGASLDSLDNAWRVRVKSMRKTTWGNDVWLTYELRTPGLIHEIREK